ncbi:MAG: type II secretion system F family protein [Oscillospiraceae bacterium]|jgi:type IV pilus assembly protein PilC
MPAYSYTALDMKSKKVRGEATAADYEELVVILRSRQLSLIGYYEKPLKKRAGYRLKAAELSDFSRELSAMLSAGVPMIKAIDILQKGNAGEKLKKIYSSLYSDINDGHSFSEALRLQVKAFDELFINICFSGEQSGTLDKITEKAAEYYQKKHRREAKIKAATLYPKILLALMTTVVIIIFTIVLPRFFRLFEGIELPFVTKILIGLSEFLINRWYLIIIAAAVFFAAFSVGMKRLSVRIRYDKVKLRLPVLGRLFRIISTAAFAEAFSSLYSSGISAVGAMSICRTIIQNKYIESGFDKAIEIIWGGGDLAFAIGEIDGLEPKLSQLILIGQESGQLDKLLASAAKAFEYEAENAAERLITLIEPLLIIIVAAVIGFIALAVFLPVMTLYQNIGV